MTFGIKKITFYKFLKTIIRKKINFHKNIFDMCNEMQNKINERIQRNI